MKKMLLAAMAVACMAVAAQAVEIKLAHIGAPISAQNTAGKIFADKVAQKTNGEVKIVIYDSGTLGNEKNLQEGVRSGTVDMTMSGTFSHLIPWGGILELPLLYRDMDHFVKVFNGESGKRIAENFEKAVRMKVLFFIPHGGFRYMTTRGVPIYKPSDMVGLKIRNPNVPAFNIMIKAVGAVPIPLDFAELYLALDRGVVQGQHNPTSNIVGAKFYEVQDNMSMIPWGISPHAVSMSMRAWDRLTPEQQAAVLEAGVETSVEYPDVAKKEEQEQLDFLKTKLKVIPPEEIDIAAFQKILDEIAMPELEKEYGADAIKMVRDIIAVK